MRRIRDIAHDKGLKAHIDGARLLNAVAATGIAAKDYAQGFDSAWIDLSKGLGCPVGAVLCGTQATSSPRPGAGSTASAAPCASPGSWRRPASTPSITTSTQLGRDNAHAGPAPRPDRGRARPRHRRRRGAVQHPVLLGRAPRRHGRGLRQGLPRPRCPGAGDRGPSDPRHDPSRGGRSRHPAGGRGDPRRGRAPVGDASPEPRSLRASRFGPRCHFASGRSASGRFGADPIAAIRCRPPRSPARRPPGACCAGDGTGCR